jgi:hypothetical protein
MNGHEKECALAALAFRIERAKVKGDKAELKEMRNWYREILTTKCEEDTRGNQP